MATNTSDANQQNAQVAMDDGSDSTDTESDTSSTLGDRIDALTSAKRTGVRKSVKRTQVKCVLKQADIDQVCKEAGVIVQSNHRAIKLRGQGSVVFDVDTLYNIRSSVLSADKLAGRRTILDSRRGIYVRSIEALEFSDINAQPLCMISQDYFQSIQGVLLDNAQQLACVPLEESSGEVVSSEAS